VVVKKIQRLNFESSFSCLFKSYCLLRHNTLKIHIYKYTSQTLITFRVEWFDVVVFFVIVIIKVAFSQKSFICKTYLAIMFFLLFFSGLSRMI